jgi:hypothetical protein
MQECTNTGHQVAVATKFCSVEIDMCGSLAWNVLRVTFFGAQNFELAPRFLEYVCNPTLLLHYLAVRQMA